MDSLIAPLATHKPELLHEGVGGVTPLYMALNIYLRKAVSNPGRKPRTTAIISPILWRPLFTFEIGYQDPVLRDEYATWKACSEFAEKWPTVRQLMSLEEERGFTNRLVFSFPGFWLPF